ncbi:MAG: adenine deaminase [candidate division WOR-3 bacterium]|nr:adenine deaminase [candidate division WOR-3 bacterium]MCX7837548.1 adenine deaminase [candidate division WOR-3 bacterium]MDW8113638.1 adenine deaminase [candidate division WOR-3 bacterium]
MEKNNLISLIKAAKGEKKGSLLIKNCQILNLFTGEIEKNNILIYDEYIAGIGKEYERAEKIIEADNLYALPGFIESHIHIESSLLSLSEFSYYALLSGTTTCVCDPHEITNVLGVDGIRYFLKESEKLLLTFYFYFPSCVPATPFEDLPFKISFSSFIKLLKNKRIIGLGEVMNFLGVINCEQDLINKIYYTERFNKIIDGHSPLLSSKNLNAYLSAGIYSDHEITNLEEAKEKLKKGMWVMIREGSAAKNLLDLKEIIKGDYIDRLILVSDDIHPEELILLGHLNRILKKAVSYNIPVHWLVRMVSFNPANFFGFKRLGLIAPGYKADINLVNNLKEFKTIYLIKNGKVIVEKEKVLNIKKEISQTYLAKKIYKTIKVKKINEELLKIEEKRNRLIRVIKIIPNQIITEELLTYPKIENNLVVSDKERDILKLLVINRHKREPQIGIGFVNGFNLKEGAIASSVSHDSHHIIACGVDDKSILLAVNKIIEEKGGLVVSNEKEILGFLPLRIAGLMSDLKAEEVSLLLNKLLNLTKKMGCLLENPFITLSFLALPVIPELKLTDKGYFSTKNWQFVPLWS